MFDFFKKKKTSELIIGSPVKGKTVPLSSVNDPTFSEGMLGKGAAILPSEGKIYAPADGTIETLFDTLHAFSLSTADGVEILVHVGLDTVKMEGDGFTGYVHSGDAVKKGDLVLEVDLDKVKAAGYDTSTLVVICNTDDYGDVRGLDNKEVQPGDDVIVITK